MKHRALLSKVVLVGACVGLALSSYSLAHKVGFTSGAFCDINTTFNCDVVNRGPFSDIANVPVAFLGVMAYLFFAAASFLKLRQPHDRNLSLFLFLGTGGGLLFSFYLSGIEAFILHTWCIVCLSSQVTVAVLFAASAWLFLGERSASRLEQVKEIVEDAAQELKELR